MAGLGLKHNQHVSSASQRAWSFILSQENFSTQNGSNHKCLPSLYRGDKVIYGFSKALVSWHHNTSEALPNSMPQNRSVNFLTNSL